MRVRRVGWALLLLLASPVCALAQTVTAFPRGSACAELHAADAASVFRALAMRDARELAALDGQAFTLQVVDPTADRWVTERSRDTVRLAYRMGRNDVTEGWNWHPEAALAGGDYYRYKYLPLGIAETEVAPERIESDLPGRAYPVRVVRRDAYYFAFDNPYAFYPRNDEDDGFAVRVAAADTEAAPAADTVRLVVRGRWTAPWRAESTTYWRAIHANPVELTLKNHYFMGQLETVWFCTSDGRLLGRLDGAGRF